MNVSKVRELSSIRELGDFIRDQRRSTGVSLRKLASIAGVSNPYLSQVERGLRRPSAEMLQAIAKGLRISANTLYVKAGLLDEEPKLDLQAAIMGDPGLTERQKQALLAVYDSFREETARRRGGRPRGAAKPRSERGPRRSATSRPRAGTSARTQPRTQSKGGA